MIAAEPPLPLTPKTILVVDGQSIDAFADGKLEDPVRAIEFNAATLRKIAEHINDEELERQGLDWKIEQVSLHGLKDNSVAEAVEVRSLLPFQEREGRLAMRAADNRATMRVRIADTENGNAHLDADLIVEKEGTKPHTTTEPGKISFKLGHGGPLQPGIYPFDITVRFSMPNKELRPFTQTYTVDAYVSGRVLGPLRITSLGSRKSELRVGDGANVEIDVYSIGTGSNGTLGTGTLRLSQESTRGDPGQLLFLALPLKGVDDKAKQTHGPVIVPRYDGRFNFSNAPGESQKALQHSGAKLPSGKGVYDQAPYTCHEMWRDSPLWGPTSQVKKPFSDPAMAAEYKGQRDLLVVHVVRLQLPDAFQPAKWKAEVKWDALSTSSHSSQSGGFLVQADEREVRSGLLVEPRVCLVNEGMPKFKVVSDRKLGDELTVVVRAADPNSTASQQIKLTRVAGGSTSFYEYENAGIGTSRRIDSSFLSKPGRYSAQIDKHSLPTAVADDDELLAPTLIHVCFRTDLSHIANEIVVFASEAIPLDVYFAYHFGGYEKEDFPRPWFDIRKKAIGVSFDNSVLSDAYLQDLSQFSHHAGVHNATSELPEPSTLRKVDPVLHADDLHFTLRLESGNESAHAAVERADSASDSGLEKLSDGVNAKPKWWDLNVGLTAQSKACVTKDAILTDTGDIPHGRKIPRLVQYEQHLLLIGIDDATNVHARVWRVPLTIQVDTESEHYKYIIPILGILAACGASAAGYWWWAHRRVKPPPGALTPDSDIGHFFGPDALFPDHPRSPPQSAAEPNADTSPPPRESDTSWFN